jgi:hypothetical protein
MADHEGEFLGAAHNRLWRIMSKAQGEIDEMKLR